MQRTAFVAYGRQAMQRLFGKPLGNSFRCRSAEATLPIPADRGIRFWQELQFARIPLSQK
jgi:hypothetical protein